MISINKKRLNNCILDFFNVLKKSLEVGAQKTQCMNVQMHMQRNIHVDTSQNNLDTHFIMSSTEEKVIYLS